MKQQKQNTAKKRAAPGAASSVPYHYTASAVVESHSRQRAAILEWLQRGAGLTTLQARNELGVMHPAGRVRELRRRGFDIKTYWRVDFDATGNPCRQGLYILMPGNKEGK